jgi:hypothetical protein
VISADPYMLMGKGVGSSSEEETVIVAVDGHPVDPYHFQINRRMENLTYIIIEEFHTDINEWVQVAPVIVDRFSTMERAVREYKMYQKGFHYKPCKYRFVEIEVQPEQIVNRIVKATVEEKV